MWNQYIVDWQNGNQNSTKAAKEATEKHSEREKQPSPAKEEAVPVG